jgi:formylglycine-generating enzyme required for sulfatase activity
MPLSVRVLIAMACLLAIAADVDREERDGNTREVGKPYVERVRARFTYDAQAAAYKRAQREEIAIDMAFIKGGRFLMGSPTDEGERNVPESPQHEVEVSDFWMSRYEVPQALVYEWRLSYSEFDRGEAGFSDAELKAMKLPRPGIPERDPDYGPWHDPKRPATGLTQYAAQQFCRWLSARTGRFYRLPTEAEWEYAARSGTKTAWHFGNGADPLGDYAWFNYRLEQGARRIGEKKPNLWGLYDLYGNVAEWTLDGWSDDYGQFAAKLSVDPWVERKKGSRFGVVRGGDWTSPAAQTRSAARRKQDDTGSESWAGQFEWFDVTDEGRRVGIRFVSPVKPDKDDRAHYLEPFPRQKQ